MKCYVYERIESVLYVIGVNNVTTPSEVFAEALKGSGHRPDPIRYRDSSKPFRGMNDKRVMYAERIGSYTSNGQPVTARAKHRAAVLNMEYAEITMDITTKRKRK